MKGMVYLLWPVRWLLGVLVMVSGGALLGAFLFPVIGTLFSAPYTLGELLRHGAYNLGFYALIWAPGVSFVWCVIKARRQGRN
jgi:hypothetical protein